MAPRASIPALTEKLQRRLQRLGYLETDPSKKNNTPEHEVRQIDEWNPSEFLPILYFCICGISSQLYNFLQEQGMYHSFHVNNSMSYELQDQFLKEVHHIACFLLRCDLSMLGIYSTSSTKFQILFKLENEYNHYENMNEHESNSKRSLSESNSPQNYIQEKNTEFNRNREYHSLGKVEDQKEAARKRLLFTLEFLKKCCETAHKLEDQKNYNNNKNETKTQNMVNMWNTFEGGDGFQVQDEIINENHSSPQSNEKRDQLKNHHRWFSDQLSLNQMLWLEQSPSLKNTKE
eukprot:gb/GECH01010400.1/.p1 GENE.gb/GECH01010400.1/~~gb/GECH01010400.1/.p1  ORF type:complete len:290 (+),score=83.97 gb/GECH01010400.1/:1-870(+)